VLITKVVASGCADDYELLQVGSSTAPSASTVAAAVWGTATSGLTSAGTAGKAVVDILADTGTDGVVLANDAITNAKIATDAIGASEVAAGALVAGTEIAGLADEADVAVEVWATATSGLTTAGTTGKALVDIEGDVDGIQTHGDTTWATATGFSTHSASDVWTNVTRSLTDKNDFFMCVLRFNCFFLVGHRFLLEMSVSNAIPVQYF